MQRAEIESWIREHVEPAGGIVRSRDRPWATVLRVPLADAGTPLLAPGDALDAWLATLPLYAELQRGEAAHAAEHLRGGVPDRRIETLRAAYERLLARERPLEAGEIARLRAFSPRFAALCAELAPRPRPRRREVTS